jgi:hypothetical protein
MKTMKQWSVTFVNTINNQEETDYFYSLKEFMTAINNIATDKSKYFLKSGYDANYKPRS